MGAFEYKALDARGRTRKGVEEGDSPRAVRQLLRERGWTPLELRDLKGGGGDAGVSPLFRRTLSAAELSLFSRQFATLVQAGTPVEQALATIGRQSEKRHLKRLVGSVRSRVMEGRTVADALAAAPAAFDELYRQTVSAGEHAGQLGEVLERLADHVERRHFMRQKLVLALLYPAILTLTAVGVVTGLLAYVVPQVVQVFSDINQELPALTRAMITISDFLREEIHLLVGGGLLLAVGGIWLGRIHAVRRAYHALLLRVPLVAVFQRAANAARFTRTFGILVRSGVPALEGLRIAGRVLGNLVVREAVEEVSERVREGEGIHAALERRRIFPPMILQLIASGEAGGNLGEMLERAADSQERELESLSAMLLGVFEPLLILVMGGVVLLIVSAILLPIFELNQLVA